MVRAIKSNTTTTAVSYEDSLPDPATMHYKEGRILILFDLTENLLQLETGGGITKNLKYSL